MDKALCMQMAFGCSGLVALLFFFGFTIYECLYWAYVRRNIRGGKGSIDWWGRKPKDSMGDTAGYA